MAFGLGFIRKFAMSGKSDARVMGSCTEFRDGLLMKSFRFG